MVDLIVSFNDPLRGPTALMYENTDGNKDPSLPLKVAVKSQLTLSLMDKETTIKTADAVLPFPDLQKISFSYLFTVSSDSGPITGSISYIVPQSENIKLYRMIPTLKEKLSSISLKFQDWTYKTGLTSLPKEFHNLLTTNLLSGSEAVFEKEVKPGEIDIIAEVASGSPDYLLKKVKKNLEYAIFELFTEKPVIITGKSRFAVEYGMATLDFLIPHKQLRKIMYSEDFVDPLKFTGKVDVIGVSSKHDKKYSNDYVIINVDKFEVKGLTKGKKNYFKNFINKIKDSDINHARQDIFVFTSSLLKLTESILDLFSSIENVAEEEINEITKDMEVDEKEAITEIAATFNPLIAEKIRINLSEKVTSWMDDFN